MERLLRRQPSLVRTRPSSPSHLLQQTARSPLASGSFVAAGSVINGAGMAAGAVLDENTPVVTASGLGAGSFLTAGSTAAGESSLVVGLAIVGTMAIEGTVSLARPVLVASGSYLAAVTQIITGSMVNGATGPAATALPADTTVSEATVPAAGSPASLASKQRVSSGQDYLYKGRKSNPYWRRLLGPARRGVFFYSWGRGCGSRSCRVYFDEPPGNCVASQSRNVVDSEFIHEPLPVPLDRLDADAKFPRNLLIALPLGD